MSNDVLALRELDAQLLRERREPRLRAAVLFVHGGKVLRTQLVSRPRGNTRNPAFHLVVDINAVETVVEDPLAHLVRERNLQS